MKKIYWLLLLLIMFIPSISAKNRINRIDIDVYIDEYGNGKITEKWDMYVDTGTEVYKPLGNMGNSKISNFQVSMDGQMFTYLSKWNVNASFDNKAYKNGISNNELCFGMSKYGNHIYTLTYDVSNMIYNTNDSQVLYYKFINDSMNPAPKDISVTIRSFYQYEDTLDVWGYGYKGYAYVSDGKISASNEGNFNSSMYTVLLVKYKPNTYNTTNTLKGYDDFNKILDMAEENTFEYKYKPNIFEKIINFIFFIFHFIVYGIVAYAIIRIAKNSGYKKYRRVPIDNVNNFREIPCNKDIFKTYLLSEIYGLNSNKSDFLGALLLKWLKEGQIKIIKKEVKGLFTSKEETVFDLTKPITTDNQYENEIYDILVVASKDKYLEAKELEKWCKNNYNKYILLFDKILDKEVKKAKDNLEISKEDKKEICSINLHEEAVKLAGLKKFLIEFSKIDEKQPIEVALWDYYLIYAQIFGIAKEVAKQFEKFYPEVYETNQQYSGFTYSDFIMINSISTRSYSAATSARSRAQSYSSGGGGFSSGGGGGGSFGGGSGGGCR